jgi:tetratricopeptide (TPR) repeat protein
VTRLIPAGLAFGSLLFICGALAQQSTKPPDPKPPADSKPVDPSQIPEEGKPAEPGKQGPPGKPIEPGKQVEEPPEEDEALVDKPCVLNPLEAGRNIETGNFYYKKAKYGAAANRYRSATCWDPSSAEAFLKLGEADEKLHNSNGEREAFEKYLSLAPQAKNAAEIKKKIAKLPPPKTQ